MNLLNSLRHRPNFFLVGAARSGTTRLHHLLGQHPEVFTSRYKEPGFFDSEAPRPGRIEQYLELFRDVEGARAIGESSMTYSRCKRFPGTAQRIHEFNLGARLIYIVRHPLRRIESSWIQRRDFAPSTPRDFCKVVRSDSIDSIDGTLYWKQLNQYRDHFPDTQILPLFFEEFIRDEAATLRRCFDFLGVDPAVFVDCTNRERQNASAQKREATPMLDVLHQMPQKRVLGRLVPRAVKQKLQAALMRPIQSKPLWDEATWSWTVEQLRADTEQFLAHTGKPADFWGWDVPGETGDSLRAHPNKQTWQ